MRTSLLAAVLLFTALDAAAQSAARSRPPGTMPLDEVPPPPPLVETDPALEQETTVRSENGDEIQEYRVGGKVQMIRVTPKNGAPYFLVDNRGDGTLMRQDNPLDNGVRVPQWTLFTF
jgi:hypothetical protein